jgi:hypothetical protein
MTTQPTKSTTEALNIKLDMDKVNELLEREPRVNLTMTVQGQEQTIAEIVRTYQPGMATPDTNINVLC